MKEVGFMILSSYSFENFNFEGCNLNFGGGSCDMGLPISTRPGPRGVGGGYRFSPAQRQSNATAQRHSTSTPELHRSNATVTQHSSRAHLHQVEADQASASGRGKESAARRAQWYQKDTNIRSETNILLNASTLYNCLLNFCSFSATSAKTPILISLFLPMC